MILNIIFGLIFLGVGGVALVLGIRTFSERGGDYDFSGLFYGPAFIIAFLSFWRAWDFFGINLSFAIGIS